MITQQEIAQALVLSGATTLGLLGILEILTTAGALILLWEMEDNHKATKLILTPIFIFLPLVDTIYLGYYGAIKLKKGSIPKKIVSSIK